MRPASAELSARVSTIVSMWIRLLVGTFEHWRNQVVSFARFECEMMKISDIADNQSNHADIPETEVSEGVIQFKDKPLTAEEKT